MSLIVIMLISCGERIETPVAMNSEEATGMWEQVPMAPQAPDAGIPFVKEVGYYHDLQWTKPLTGTVQAGKMIFVKVVFSEGMKLKVADGNEARPVLYYKIGGKLTRFRIVGFRAQGEDFVSGDAKPIKTQATYLCKYVVKPQDNGVFTVAVGKFSLDRQENAMNAFYTHQDTLSLGAAQPKTTLPSPEIPKTTPPTPEKPDAGIPFVKEVGYYHDWRWTKPLTGTVSAGKTIFVKVVFSEGMKLKVADGNEARPVLYYKIGSKLTRFRIAGLRAQGEDFVSGDAKPIKTQATYLCKYVVKPQDNGVFTVAVGKFSVDREGNAMNAFYTHQDTLWIGVAQPKTTLPSPGTLILVPARDSGTRGDNITNHTDIIIAGELKKKPPQGTTIQLYNNGIPIPDATDTTIDAKNRWAVSTVLPEGRHTLTARSEKGTAMSVKTQPLVLTVDTTAPIAEVTAHLDGNLLIATISGEGVAAYRYAVVIGEQEKNTEFTDPIDVRATLNEDVWAFPAVTLALCVIGEDRAGNRQAEPTVVHIEKVTPALAKKPEPEPEPKPQDGRRDASQGTGTPPKGEAESEPKPQDGRRDTPQEVDTSPADRTSQEVDTSPADRTSRRGDTPPKPEPEPKTHPTDIPPPNPPGAKDPPGTPPPVPVELSNFRPVRQKETGAVVITWSTQSELNNAGFFIKRSQQRNGKFKVINATMVPGAGTSSEKQSYTYTDTTAQPNVVYYYQIEDVSLDGNRQTLTRGIRLKGHVGAAGKATTLWGELKSSRK